MENRRKQSAHFFWNLVYNKRHSSRFVQLNALLDDKLKVAYKKISIYDRVEHIVGNRENAGYHKTRMSNNQLNLKLHI